MRSSISFLVCGVGIALIAACSPAGPKAGPPAALPDASLPALPSAAAPVMTEVESAEGELHVAKVDVPASPTAAQCADDTWLLSQFSVGELMVDKRHHVPCCKKGVLLGTDDAHLCEIDWPSSDVPGCSLWTELRDKLAAAFPGDKKPKMVVSNMMTLEAHAKKHFQCQP